MMMRKSIFINICIIIFFLWSSTINAEELKVYQQGIDGYFGTADAIITNLFVQDTDGNGVTAKEGYLRAFHQFYEARSLIRFNDISLPLGTVFVRAELKLVVTDWDGGMMLAGYYLDKEWDIQSESLGWKNCMDNTAWSEPGAASDVIKGKSFIINGFSGNGIQEKIIPLDNEVVQQWLSSPKSNFGILITILDKEQSAWIHSSEDSNKNYRPQLILYYE
jgi:hypothetical protein